MPQEKPWPEKSQECAQGMTHLRRRGAFVHGERNAVETFRGRPHVPASAWTFALFRSRRTADQGIALCRHYNAAHGHDVEGLLTQAIDRTANILPRTLLVQDIDRAVYGFNYYNKIKILWPAATALPRSCGQGLPLQQGNYQDLTSGLQNGFAMAANHAFSSYSFRGTRRNFAFAPLPMSRSCC